MQIDWAQGPLDAGILYSTLNRHLLLPASLQDPNICLAAANQMRIGFLHDGGDVPLAILLESNPEPGLVGLMFITGVARLHQKKDDLIEISLVLRDRWFKEMKADRVESRVPVERTQTIRCLKHLGFRLETLPCGIRNGIVLNGKSKSLSVLGLLPSDPIRKLSKEDKEPIIH
jgi:hypothetical protein